MSVSQSSSLLPLHSLNDFQPFWGNLWAPPLRFGRRPPQSNCPPGNVRCPDNGTPLESQQPKGGISRTTPHKLTPVLPSLPPILHSSCQNSIPSYSKALRGLSVQSQVNTHLHAYYNFAGSLVETVPKSLRHSCGSELTWQGISLP